MTIRFDDDDDGLSFSSLFSLSLSVTTVTLNFDSPLVLAGIYSTNARLFSGYFSIVSRINVNTFSANNKAISGRHAFFLSAANA